MVTFTFLLQGFAISEANAGSSSTSPDQMSQCIGSVENGKCMCKFAVTHFSTFAVGDSDVLDAASPVFPPPPSQSSPDVIAGVAGGVVGGIAFVVIVAFVIVKMKNRYQSSAEIQPFSIETIQQKSEAVHGGMKNRYQSSAGIPPFSIETIQQKSEAVHGGVAGGNATAQGTPQLTNPQTDFQLEMEEIEGEAISCFELPNQIHENLETQP